MREELLSPENSIEDQEIDFELEGLGLRPACLDDFIGQPELKEHLSIILTAAKKGSAHLIICFCRATWARKDHVSQYRCERDGSISPHNFWPWQSVLVIWLRS